MKQLKNFSRDNMEVSDSDILGEVIGKYKDKTEDELVGELLKAAAAAKADGSFSEQSLDDFKELVFPHLSETQKEKLANLISVIKIEE